VTRGVGDQAMPDAVTEAFEQLRSDIEDLLRKRQASLQRSMSGVLREDKDTNREESLSTAEILSTKTMAMPDSALAVDPGTVENQHIAGHERCVTAGSFDDQRCSIPYQAQSSQNLRHAHWSSALMTSQEWRVTAKMRNVWKRVSSSHYSMVSRLPRLVSRGVDLRLRSFLTSVTWEFFRTVVLIMDACVVIAELVHASATARDMGYQGGIPDVPAYLFLTDVCCLVMLSELLILWSLEFPHLDFIHGRTNRRWFNIIVIAEQILQVIGQHAYPGERSQSTFRIAVSQLSVVRLMRAFFEVPDIAFRLGLAIQESRIMISSLMRCGMPFVMCAVPFLVILIAMAVFLEEGAIVFLVNHDARTRGHAELAQFFGTLDITMLSLYKGLLGGMDWGDLYHAVEPLHWYLRFMFLLFICFNFIAVFNIVAGVFVKVAFNRSESDPQLLILKEKRSRKVFLETMHEVFCRLDDGDDGKISTADLAEKLQEADIAAYLSILGLDVNEVGKLVKILDEDGSADINRDEFIFGCMRLTGDAKSIDLAILQREVKAVTQKVTAMHKQLKRNQGVSSADARQMQRCLI